MTVSGAASDATLGAVVRLVGDEVCSGPPLTSCLNNNPPGLPPSGLGLQSSLSHGGQTGPLSTGKNTSPGESCGLTASQVLAWVPQWAHTATRSQGIPHTWELVRTP